MARANEQLWIGLVELRSADPTNHTLKESKGAFVNVVTWAATADDYRRKAEMIAQGLGLFVAAIENEEPVAIRRDKAHGTFEGEIEDMISRAETNPNAIIYGTFHTFDRDDA